MKTSVLISFIVCCTLSQALLNKPLLWKLNSKVIDANPVKLVARQNNPFAALIQGINNFFSGLGFGGSSSSSSSSSNGSSTTSGSDYSTVPAGNPASLGVDSVKQYSGYINVGPSNEDHMFYWFFESRNKPQTDPVVLWLTGGPGCSSLEALFFENGPCKLTNV
ncbi:carboxypeptidase C [Sugiyamaella lignohabitans]|uniref:carboxypeptidase C n=1 Tax=Sugiyamaella lignohabitans TaxID=796027 RepID=A0A167CTB3_9ASCO|nr:carboxypeptidase C [Sugiyamaella lignohabitans]ANB12082.1 carboxypeptidase C [Sugiyamaella lignohabitans]